MMSLTIEASSETDLVQRLETTLHIMGKKIGLPSVVYTWTFLELKEFGEKYEKVTGRSVKQTLLELFNVAKLELIPANRWPEIVNIFQREMDDTLYAKYSGKYSVRF